MNISNYATDLAAVNAILNTAAITDPDAQKSAVDAINDSYHDSYSVERWAVKAREYYSF